MTTGKKQSLFVLTGGSGAVDGSSFTITGGVHPVDAQDKVSERVPSPLSVFFSPHAINKIVVITNNNFFIFFVVILVNQCTALYQRVNIVELNKKGG